MTLKWIKGAHQWSFLARLVWQNSWATEIKCSSHLVANPPNADSAHMMPLFCTQVGGLPLSWLTSCLCQFCCKNLVVAKADLASEPSWGSQC